jgi:hypothetical protein
MEAENANNNVIIKYIRCFFCIKYQAIILNKYKALKCKKKIVISRTQYFNTKVISVESHC